MNQRLSSLALGLLASMPALCLATEPLRNPFRVGAHEGFIYPARCCWVDLPESPKLKALMHAQQCTAGGGPVGRFEVTDGRIWLTGLRTCSGDIPLRDVYPEMRAPVVATWLEGSFGGSLDYQCSANAFKNIYRYAVRITVSKGVVTHLQMKSTGAHACADSTP